MRIFIAGGTGLVGARLVRRLRKRNDDVVVLLRRLDAWERVGPDCTILHGDPTQAGPWQNELANCDAAINLTGAGIFDRRWTPEYKRLIRESRVNSTANIVEAHVKSPRRADGTPKVLVNASAIGYYGPCGDEELDEGSPPGRDFLSGVVGEWEAAARAAEPSGVRVAIIRTGIVHDPLGGVLKQLGLVFKLGLGGPVGMALKPKDWGKQYWSWIHYADLAGIYLLAIDNPEATGPINGTAPYPITNKEFAKAFGNVLGRPAFNPAPAFALRIVLGEVADVVTTGHRIVPKKALALGYRFEFPTMEAALADLYRPKPAVATEQSRGLAVM